MFNVKNKDTRKTSETSFLCPYCQLWTCFKHFSSVFIVAFWTNECFRSSRQRCSVGKGVLRNFTKLTGLRPASLLKKRLWHRRFPVNFAKFLRTAFLQDTYGWLLLNSVQAFFEQGTWLILTFFLCLHNQLSSLHSIVTY